MCASADDDCGRLENGLVVGEQRYWSRKWVTGTKPGHRQWPRGQKIVNIRGERQCVDDIKR